MPNYVYKAKNDKAQDVSGEIFARDQDDAVERITRMGLLPVTIEEGFLSGAGKAEGGPHAAAGYRRPVRSKDVYLFSRQLATMIKSGVPILRALHLMSRQEKNTVFKEIMDHLSEGIKNGRPLSECLADYPKVFSAFYVAMIRVGEEGGNLKEILLRVADYQKRVEALRSRVRAALAYPVLMLVIGGATVFFILAFIMPKITHLFSTMAEDLPMVTVILMRTSEWLKSTWHWVILSVLGAGIGVRKWSATNGGRWGLSRIQLKIPLYSTFILKAELTRFARTLSLLLHSGISLIRAIDIAVPVLTNEVVKRELARTREDLEGGLSLGESLRRSAVIPDMMANVVAVGEESGSLESILEDIAGSYEQETDETVKTLTNLLEPLMILAVGLVVGFIVMGMLLPIFQIDILAR